MVGPIDRILNQYATPEIKSAIKAEAEKAKETATVKMEQTANVARTEVKYTKEALKEVARAELKAWFAQNRVDVSKLSCDKQKALEKMAELIAGEVLKT